MSQSAQYTQIRLTAQPSPIYGVASQHSHAHTQYRLEWLVGHAQVVVGHAQVVVGHAQVVVGHAQVVVKHAP